MTQVSSCFRWCDPITSHVDESDPNSHTEPVTAPFLRLCCMTAGKSVTVSGRGLRRRQRGLFDKCVSLNLIWDFQTSLRLMMTEANTMTPLSPPPPPSPPPLRHHLFITSFLHLPPVQQLQVKGNVSRGQSEWGRRRLGKADTGREGGSHRVDVFSLCVCVRLCTEGVFVCGGIWRKGTCTHAHT